MEDTHGPHRAASRGGGHARRTALVAAPGLAAVGLAAAVLAAGPAHARTPHPAAQRHARQAAHPGHTAPPSPSPSHSAQPAPSPSRSAQPTHTPSQPAREGSPRSREAQGGHRAKGADLHLVFDRPEAAKDSGVIWRWTVVNEGAGTADDVVATQQVTSGHKILGLSKPCASDHETVVCRYDTIGAGDKRAGWIKTSGSLKGGPLRVDAKMTWRDRRTGSDAGAEGNHHPGH
ncbi:hypothetical protein GCM10023195_63500 [Actinoallomurus liliacearum]|uniref:DUF11 domain-containing protein n=1 Tax=Actinoallomurus liliacearum TaxID=1080073 RepID=A0ABP8TRG9_9ACTN